MICMPVWHESKVKKMGSVKILYGMKERDRFDVSMRAVNITGLPAPIQNRLPCRYWVVWSIGQERQWNNRARDGIVVHCKIYSRRPANHCFGSFIIMNKIYFLVNPSSLISTFFLLIHFSHNFQFKSPTNSTDCSSSQLVTFHTPSASVENWENTTHTINYLSQHCARLMSCLPQHQSPLTICFQLLDSPI